MAGARTWRDVRQGAHEMPDMAMREKLDKFGPNRNLKTENAGNEWRGSLRSNRMSSFKNSSRLTALAITVGSRGRPGIE